jgi:hypothetical protein
MIARHLLKAGMILLLSACGGSGGSSAVDQIREVFSTSASVNATENGADVSYSVNLSALGNSLTYSISGGEDRALFGIDASGVLTFNTPPDFERPEDADGDNVYLVTIRISDGLLFGTLALSVSVTDENEPGRLTRVATGFSQPLFVAAMTDGSGRVYVVGKGGQIDILDPATGAVNGTPFLDISTDVSTNSERGLLGFALAPDFATSRQFYVATTNLSGDTEIRRYEADAANPETTDPSTKDVILQVAQPAANHNGGWLDFGADGLLYIALGDGGGGGDPFANGQDTTTLLGTILRLDVSSDDFPGDALRDYAIPAGNPFVGTSGADEIFAYGLRNPYRASFDTTTGLIYIGDVGQDAHEEVDILDPATDAGANFGWNRREGIAPYNGGADDPSFTNPVIDYSHTSGFGRSVTGGYVYRGPEADLQGLYIFGDFISGRFWSVPADQLDPDTPILQDSFDELTTSLVPDEGEIDNISSFGVDADNNLYIVDFDGDIFRIDPA